RRSLSTCSDMFLPKIGYSDDSRSHGKMIAITDLQGAIRIDYILRKPLRSMVNRLSMARNQIDISCSCIPVRKCLINQLSVQTPYHGIQTTEHLLVDGSLSKYLTHLLTETFWIG